MEIELLKAARVGDSEKFKKLASSEDGILNGATDQGNTVLHQAARFGHLHVVNEAIKLNPSLIFRSNDKGETAAHLAARGGFDKIVRSLIRSIKAFRGARIAGTRDKYGNTPLHGAVRNNRVSVYRELFLEDKTSLTFVNDIGESPLSIAIDKNWSALAKDIIEDNKETLKFIGPNGHTPLHLAAIRCQSDVVARILEIGVAGLAEKGDEKGRTALHYAAAAGDKNAVKVLVEYNSSLVYIKDGKKKRPIHLAAERGKRDLVKALLEPAPETIELLDDQQQSILHIAAEKGNKDVVAYIMGLKEMEDLVNSQDVSGNTPLHLAAGNFHSNIVYKLSRKDEVEIRMLNNARHSALALVQNTESKDREMQKHLTLKALKSAYSKRMVHTDETVGQDIQSSNPIDLAEESSEKLKEMGRTLTVVATLIATFTFTAAFTLPGGFKQDGPDEGMATNLIAKAAFQAFVITDTLAVTSSTSAAVILFWSSSYSDNESFLDALPIAIGLTWLSLVAMAAAFVTGLFAVLSRRLWLAITACVIGCLGPLLLYVLAPLVFFLPQQYKSSLPHTFFENNPFVFVVRLIRMRW